MQNQMQTDSKMNADNRQIDNQPGKQTRRQARKQTDKQKKVI